ncbi:fungal-specific transcription factor domain-containing protein [Colletotrichum phormii]|uniref:Fungal-specific transcription factor domain-containing protein n=1 Tax=Colletotrichum phormii TaxID=359342 RepID=A0AAI9ZWB4_9PEZI|nr:fungal-specific transcription factor domain-containing protein [Colletotrichum phormii]KAK1639402.1 fungal-specific transcription factor domain-containing protein [Colletotrichum phormii]
MNQSVRNKKEKSRICHVLSSFDSLHNPFRSEVPRLFNQSPLLLYCVLSMSAAHLYPNEESKVVDVPLQLQTKAISYLAGQLPTPPHTNGLEVSIYRAPKVDKVVGADIKDDVLLGTIILGMISAWHDVSSTGLMHLRGSRELFKAWMSSSHLDTTTQRLMSGTQNFVVSSMVYWEAMSSFITDQDPNALSYPDAFCHHHPPRSLQTRPCPWTGVETVTFIYLAKTATLVRRLRALGRLGLCGRGEDVRNTSYSDLLQRAVNLKEEISMLETPDVGSVTDSGDIFTPPGHLITMEQCYRMAALLELYRAFPELSETQLSRGYAGLDAVAKAGGQVEGISNLALTILRTMEEIPVTSGTVSTQLLPLIIAGSVLGPESGEDTTSEGFEFMCTAGTAAEVAGWRDFVRMRTRWLYQLIRLKPVRHGLLILEEVWACLDETNDANRADDTKPDNKSCHWIDAMEEKGLETMLG